MADSYAWFEKLGWKKMWDWDTTFGRVRSGECEIFLCLNGQGGRGRDSNGTGRCSADKGAWMSVWVESTDAVYERCKEQGLEITHPPTNEPWNVREMLVRHPDGHVFRISQMIKK